MSTVACFPQAALFDLDGTLLDSAPDMHAAINAMRAAQDMPPLPLHVLRPQVSRGARAMLSTAFPHLDAAAIEAWVPGFLDAYERELGRHGAPFEGIETMLEALEAAGRPWGIVTNKPEYLARQLLPLLGWEHRCAVLVGGDTYPVRKPDPLPLVEAARHLRLAPSACSYVGDDARDIVAARAAGMRSVVALWGYRLDDDDPVAWQGDVMVEQPLALSTPAAWPQET